MGKLFVLLGHPIGHSLSPEMQNHAFRDLNLPYHYESCDVKPDDLEKAVEGIRAMGIAGFNVTVPHKVHVMQYLDDIDEEAIRIGAVNTVVNDHGRLFGTNTDGQGYLESLMETTGKNLSDKKVLIIGAGGAARGVTVALDRHGVKRLDIANRSPERAEALIEHGLRHTNVDVLTLDKAAEVAGDYDILINTTPVGMSPNPDGIPLSVHNVRPGTVLSDLIYNPLATKWLQEGERKGAVTHNGLGMFVNQGALAFERWTGQKPDRWKMRQIVLEQLKGRA